MNNLGVKYTGSFSDSSGYASASRAFITALYLSGVDVVTECCIQMKEKTSYGWEGELCKSLEDRDIPYKVKIIHLTPDMYESYTEPNKYHIGHLFFETDRLPIGWSNFCNKMGEIWTSSPFMAELFKKSGVKVPIYWFPQPIDTSLGDKRFDKFALPQHYGYLFYSIFQWIDRKNPKALLEAYWEAFDGIGDVSLLLKVFRLSYDQTEFDKIRNDIIMWKNKANVKAPPKILLSTQLLTKEQIFKLHNTGDCFVSAHRGEGFGRPFQEALLMQKPVIATSRGGLFEYLQPEHYFGIESTYVPVTEVPYIKFYTADQKWAEPNKEQLKKTMKFVYNNREVAKAKGIVAKEYIKSAFNFQKIGELMKARLTKIYSSL